MADNKEIVKKVVAAVTPIIGSAVMGALVGEIVSKIAELAVSNVHESDVTGDKELHPTDDEASLKKDQASGAENNGALAHDDVDAQKGGLKADELEADASTQEATALESGASAVRTKAGASDIEGKALKIM